MTGEPKVVLVTGVTTGIGKATAELLASKGYRVFGISRNPAGRTGSGFDLLQLDVTSDGSVAACVKSATKRTGGRIDVLHNNAGAGIIGAAVEVTPDEALRLFQINFFGVTRMTNAVLPLMRARKAGTVINMSSSGGVAALPFTAPPSCTGWVNRGPPARSPAVQRRGRHRRPRPGQHARWGHGRAGREAHRRVRRPRE